MRLSSNSKLFCLLDRTCGYVTAPVRETVTKQTEDGTRNTVLRTVYRRRRLVDFVNSQTVLCLLGYANKDAFKVIKPYGKDNYITLLMFLDFVKTNNEDLMALVDTVDSDEDDSTLAKFVEVAVKGFALKYYGLKVERKGSPEMPYMVVVG